MTVASWLALVRTLTRSHCQDLSLRPSGQDIRWSDYELSASKNTSQKYPRSLDDRKLIARISGGICESVDQDQESCIQPEGRARGLVQENRIASSIY
jgi:hypothetical protein